MEKINVAELLRDCPNGMELDCTMYDNLYFDFLNADYYGTINCYTLIDGIKTSINFTKYGTFNNHIGAKCVIYPKGKTTWEGFVPSCQFKDGDVVFYDNCVSIFKEWGDETLFRNYVKVDIGGRYPMLCDRTHSNGKGIKREARFATEEEKQVLFDAIKENGYRWNAETKTLERLPKFKDGDIVYIKTRGYNQNEFIIIFKEIKNDHIYRYISFSHQTLYTIKNTVCHLINVEEIRFATEEEKEKLFDSIKAHGYKWNEDTKTLEKLPKFKVGDRITNGIVAGKIRSRDIDSYQLDNDVFVFFNALEKWELDKSKFDINTLKPFDKVLVRNTKDGRWCGQFYMSYDKNEDYPFECTYNCWRQCIPYEGNEHLRGKTDDCDEYFKSWK